MNADLLRELLLYSPSRGDFVWAPRALRHFKSERDSVAWHGRFCGKRAGVVNGRGYRVIRVFGTLYLEHRLVWLYVTGAWPSGLLDHVNGRRDDNRFANLREADPHQNSYNACRRSDNCSGFKGVGFHRVRGKFTANIQAGAHRTFLGYFPTPEAAYAAYCKASEELHGDFGRTA